MALDQAAGISMIRLVSFLRRGIAALALGAAVAAQSSTLANPKLEDGAPGEAPAGWFFGSQSGGRATVDALAPFEGAHSACIDATASTGDQPFTNLMQSIDAAPWRGKRIVFRAAVKTADLTPGSTAQLWLRVDRPDSQVGGFDNMDDRPIRASEWAHYEVVVEVADDAVQLALGVFVLGRGKAWFDDAALETAASDAKPTGDQEQRRLSGMDPRVAAALAAAEQAPQQPFWTPWLALPALAMALFVLGLTPLQRPRGVPESTEPSPSGPEVSVVRWFALRFTIAYWLLAYLPAPFPSVLAWLPGIGATWSAQLDAAFSSVSTSMAEWTARTLFGFEDLVPPNGSGDTTQNYITSLNAFFLALLVAVVWTATLRRRPSRAASIDLLRSYLRYVLAAVCLSYGLAKVAIVHNQFPVVDEWRLGRTWGETSPMGVVWAFMGASRPYTIFAGLGEVLAAMLLIWRPTMLLGALVAIGVMTNVAMLNYCYDVPVKLSSTHLLVMGVLILLPDARRLSALLLGHRNSNDVGVPSVWQSRSTRRVRLLCKSLVIALCFGVPLWHSAKEIGAHLAEPTPPAAAPADDQGKRHLLTTRGFRWINEVPYNR